MMLILTKVLIKLISSERERECVCVCVCVCVINWLFCNVTWPTTEFNLLQRILLANDPFVLA